jgi:hypothetical protein
MKWYQSTVALIIVFLFAIGAPQLIADSEHISEETEELAEFLIVLERTDDKIHLSCKQGCLFKELSFSQFIDFWNLFTFSRPQGINEGGMTSILSNKTVDENSDFLFTIKKTKEGIQLKGIKGTAWKSLSFSCPDNNCQQAIDQYGMTTTE